MMHVEVMCDYHEAQYIYPLCFEQILISGNSRKIACTYSNSDKDYETVTATGQTQRHLLRNNA